jgi:hypothetical protein
MATLALWKKAFEFLEEKGFEVYPPSTKTGECTKDYLVLKDANTAQISTFSSEYHYYDILCYSKNYTGVLELNDKMKNVMKEFVPQLMPTGNETQAYYDTDVKAFMISVEYRACARNKNVKTVMTIY